MALWYKDAEASWKVTTEEVCWIRRWIFGNI